MDHLVFHMANVTSTISVRVFRSACDGVKPKDGVSSMIEAGFSPDAAHQMAELARWLSNGTHATLPGRVEVTSTMLEDFAPRFQKAFEALQRPSAVSAQVSAAR